MKPAPHSWDVPVGHRVGSEPWKIRFVELRGASYGRCDLRVDRSGRPFMLEINANCGLYYPPTAPGSADLCLAHDPAGHEGFTRQIVRAALRRHPGRPRAAPRPYLYPA